MDELSVFDSIAGLPLHPLVVHAAVVLLPLSALAVILVVLIRPLRERYAGLSVLGVLAGMAAALVSKESGEALERHVGDPGQHAQYGEWATIGAVVLSVATVVWYLLQRRGRGSDAKPEPLAMIVGLVAVLAAAACLGLVVIVGHSGAQATWQGTVAQSSAAGGGEAGEPEPSGAPATYTLQQVAEHADRTSCWAAVNGDVYDLTSWVARHPGGEQRILSLCGTDATAAFDAQHDGQREPQAALAEFKIGTLQG